MEEGIAKLQKHYNCTSANDAREGNRVVKTMIEKFLIVMVFFFILFVLALLVVVQCNSRFVLESAAVVDSRPVPLWHALFQPAFGLFMARAILSTISKCLRLLKSASIQWLISCVSVTRLYWSI
jgi:quinol-cytochrome oxidoreductase complex cytochrome b subunit